MLRRRVQGRQPVSRLGLEAGIVADNVLGVPIQRHDEVWQPDGLHRGHCHVNALPLMRSGRQGVLHVRVRRSF